MTEQVQPLPVAAPSLGSARAFALGVARRLVPWLVPVGLIVGVADRVVARLAVHPHPAGAASPWSRPRGRCCRLGRAVDACEGQRAAARWSGLAIGGGLGLVLGLLTGSVEVRRDAARLHHPDGAQRPGAGADPAGDPVVRHRRVGQAVPGRGRRCSSRSTSTPSTASATSTRQLIEMAPHLRPVAAGSCTGEVILPGALPSILVGLRFSLGLMWVIADRGRDHLGAVRHRLPDDERPRVPADRHRAGGHPAVRAARQAGRPVRARLERWWLRWHPGYQAK